MATAFTEQEASIILKQLKRAAKENAAIMGMRKITVDQLVAAAGISKGAFYKFYPSKELLFFDVLEEMHTEIYQAAADVLAQNAMLSTAERAAQALLAACHAMKEAGIVRFMEQDADYLMRKIPQEYLEKHYHSEDVHIREMLESHRLVPKGGIPLAVATIRGLMYTLSHQREIGELYPKVLETLVHGACRELFG